MTNQSGQPYPLSGRFGYPLFEYPLWVRPDGTRPIANRLSPSCERRTQNERALRARSWLRSDPPDCSRAPGLTCCAWRAKHSRAGGPSRGQARLAYRSGGERAKFLGVGDRVPLELARRLDLVGAHSSARTRCEPPPSSWRRPSPSSASPASRRRSGPRSSPCGSRAVRPWACERPSGGRSRAGRPRRRLRPQLARRPRDRGRCR